MTKKKCLTPLFRWPFSENISFKSRLIEWGNKVFWVSTQRFPLALCCLHFLQQVFHISVKHCWRAPTGNEEQYRWGTVYCKDPVQPWSKQMYLCVCSAVVALLPWAKEAGSFIYLLLVFNDTQVSCVIGKLSHFLLFHRKKSSFHTECLRSGWCIQSVFGVSFLYAVYVATRCV